MSLGEISRIVTEIRGSLLKAGVTSSQIAFKAKKIEDANETEVKKALSWLIGFQLVFVKRFEEARSLIPEDVWNMYINMGVKGTQEQQILDINRRLMVNQWKERPDILKRTSNAELKRKRKARKAN